MPSHAGHEFRVETLDRHHDRAAFSCGVPSLDTSHVRHGSSVIVVDALDDRAARFYAAHGFTRLADAIRLIMPMQTVAGLTAGESTRAK